MTTQLMGWEFVVPEAATGVLGNAIRDSSVLVASNCLLGPTEVVPLTGIDRSAAHPMLATLAFEQDVARIESSGAHRLERELEALGLVAVNRLSPPGHAGLSHSHPPGDYTKTLRVVEDMAKAMTAQRTPMPQELDGSRFPK